MNKTDFTYIISDTGYTIFYKSGPIGGMQLWRDEQIKVNPRYRKRSYKQMAEGDIRALLRGRGMSYMREGIATIEKELN